MLTGSLLSIIGVNNHRKDVTLFSKTFPWCFFFNFYQVWEFYWYLTHANFIILITLRWSDQFITSRQLFLAIKFIAFLCISNSKCTAAQLWNSQTGFKLKKKHYRWLKKSVPRNHLSDAHKWTTIHVSQKQLSLLHIQYWQPSYKLGLLELNCNTLVKLKYRKVQHYSGILKVSSIARRKGRGIIFLTDLESIQHKLSSDYSLNIYFSRCFTYTDGRSFLLTNPEKMSIFQRSVTKFFSGIVLTYWQELRGKSLTICFSSK